MDKFEISLQSMARTGIDYLKKSELLTVLFSHREQADSPPDISHNNAPSEKLKQNNAESNVLAGLHLAGKRKK